MPRRPIHIAFDPIDEERLWRRENNTHPDLPVGPAKTWLTLYYTMQTIYQGIHRHNSSPEYYLYELTRVLRTALTGQPLQISHVKLRMSQRIRARLSRLLWAMTDLENRMNNSMQTTLNRSDYWHYITGTEWVTTIRIIRTQYYKQLRAIRTLQRGLPTLWNRYNRRGGYGTEREWRTNRSNQLTYRQLAERDDHRLAAMMLDGGQYENQTVWNFPQRL